MRHPLLLSARLGELDLDVTIPPLAAPDEATIVELSRSLGTTPGTLAALSALTLASRQVIVRFADATRNAGFERFIEELGAALAREIEDAQGVALWKKSTGWMTNSPVLAQTAATCPVVSRGTGVWD